MKKVFKYPIPITDEFVIEMPENHELLMVDVVKGQPAIYALVNPDVKKINVPFKLCGTGHGITNADKLQYVGTFQMDFGKLVWHVFKILEV